ncbi:hypothetical protein ACFQMA_15765 [Halosimplex aquaticum]|uniref:PQQ-like domain-containing protein n=1 Tax=Halosimplex aquaticum TaxID=3026162 RepID=A0ABD5Y5X9_9EURY|nr:hypothetical protein [Halosimplex aquaticum]
MDVSYEAANTSVTIGSVEQPVPGRIRDCQELDDLLAVSITPDEHYGIDLSDAVKSAEFALPSPNRNLVGFDESGEITWIVDTPDHGTNEDHFRDLSLVSNRLLANNTDDHYYEVDPSTGEIVGSYPETQLPIGDRVVSFNGTVKRIHQLDDLVVVETGTTPTSFYGYETDGSLRWQRHGNAGLEIRDGALAETIVPNDARRAIVRLDPDTGKRVEVLESDLPDPEQYVSASE